jgi:hypothetical protein
VRLFVTEQGIAILVGAALFIAVIVLTATTKETYDDPWILYRYADNLASGYGWTFNPGVAQADAVTSPLMVLLIAAQIKIGVSVFIASSMVFLVGTWTAAQFAFLMLRSVERPLAGVIAAALVVSSPWLASLRGMESAILLGATAVALWAATTERPWITGLFLGLAVLARPDSVVLTALILLSITWRRRSVPSKELIAFTCTVFPWLLYSQFALHSLLPSTLAAKQAQLQSGQWPDLVGIFLATVFASGHLAGAAICASIALGGYLVMTFTRPRPLLLLFSASAISFLMYEFVLRIAGYPWYVASIVYTGLLLTAVGLDFVASRSLLLRIGAVGVAAALVALGILNPYQMSPERRDDATVAQWLRRNAKPHDTVASAEIGQLGYVSKLQMVDYLGLLDPRANSHIQRQDWPWWVNVYCPNYWVTSTISHHWVVEKNVLTSKPFQEEYRLVYHTPHVEVYGRTTPTCRQRV